MNDWLFYRDSDSEPHIMCIEKIYTDNTGQKQIYGNWFYRPNETFHLATRKFLQKEVVKSDVYASTDPNQIVGRCFVMCVREYFKLRPEVRKLDSLLECPRELLIVYKIVLVNCYSL